MVLRGAGEDESSTRTETQERDVFFDSGTGTVGGFLIAAANESAGASPGAILMLTDVFGAEEENNRAWMRALCVSAGLPVFALDIFRGEPFCEERYGSTSSEAFETWRSKHPPARVFGDISAAACWLRRSDLDGIAAPAASRERALAMVGFCYGGGRLLESLAGNAALGGAVAAAVAFYPTRIDAPALVAALPRGNPILAFFGSQDPIASPAVAAALDGPVTCRVFDKCGHGFAHRGKLAEGGDGDAAREALDVTASVIRAACYGCDAAL